MTVCLSTSEQYFSYIHDENKLHTINDIGKGGAVMNVCSHALIVFSKKQGYDEYGPQD